MRRLVIGMFVAVLVSGVLVRERMGKTSAADSENLTWGATDPTWSPDSKFLAFSLFGSIWRMPAEGGAAEQISSSAGYHAHPAWSPKGDRIAFLRGQSPAGRIPNVSGSLVLLDLASGREREIRTPYPVAGTIAWSPDGERLVCALATGPAALLHEIRLSDGAVTEIQRLPQELRTGSAWVDASWSPNRDEVFFTGQRTVAPQIWSFAPSGPPITVQLPLTRYRREDIVQLHSISALPDGSGVIYSADVVNGAGNFELYRVARQGGKPVALTETTRDEFSPAVSPDGSRIALVSNQMGNIDLFTMPASGGVPRHVRISSLKFRGPAGRLRLRLEDEQGRATPARVYVRASDGKAYAPAGSPIYYYALDPGQPREGFFIARGDDTFPLPAGRSRLVVLKGVEYNIAERTVEVPEGETAELTVRLERWTNWAQRGWFTGENHFHANYNGSYYQRPIQSLAWLEAEDLNTANMIVANSEGAFIHDREFFRGAPDPLSTPRYILYWGEEYRNSYPLGHMALLNIRKLVPPFFTSVPGSNSSYDYPLNTSAALATHQQGGLVTYVHPMSAGRDVFDTTLGAKEAPVVAALGGLDAMDILPFGPAAYELWYRFLNCGFTISAGAGTDVFTNWRGINNIPGGSREYVEVGPQMSWDRWIARLREGRNFVTNGPLLTFSVNGEPMGARIQVPSGQPYRAKLAAEVTARAPLERVELLQNGRVIETREAAGARSLRLDLEVPVHSSSWFAVRATGQPARGIAGAGSIPRAHSGPIYVQVDGRPVLIREDLELMLRWLDRLWALLEERNNFGSSQNRARAQEMIAQARKHYEQKLARVQ